MASREKQEHWQSLLHCPLPLQGTSVFGSTPGQSSWQSTPQREDGLLAAALFFRMNSESLYCFSLTVLNANWLELF